MKVWSARFDAHVVVMVLLNPEPVIVGTKSMMLVLIDVDHIQNLVAVLNPTLPVAAASVERLVPFVVVGGLEVWKEFTQVVSLVLLDELVQVDSANELLKAMIVLIDEVITPPSRCQSGRDPAAAILVRLQDILRQVHTVRKYKHLFQSYAQKDKIKNEI